VTEAKQDWDDLRITVGAKVDSAANEGISAYVERLLSVAPRVASLRYGTTRILSNEIPPKPLPQLDNLTYALDYKTSHKARPLPLPKVDLPRSRFADEVATRVATSIPYNTRYTPSPSLQPGIQKT
jgi:hypothetical protein